MENIHPPGRRALAAIMATMLSACAAAPDPTSYAVEAKAPLLGITQQGYGKAVHYVYCDVAECPLPTRKTLLAPAPGVSIPAAPARQAAISGHAVNIAFPFNSGRMADADTRLLRSASAEAWRTRRIDRVEITARSDFVGPPAGQARIVEARIHSLRRIVVQQAPGARFTVRREVAAPVPVASDVQARQRVGTVRFIHTTEHNLKGTTQ